MREACEGETREVGSEEREEDSIVMKEVEEEGLAGRVKGPMNVAPDSSMILSPGAAAFSAA